MELDDETRARIARGWTSSCLTQAEYAAKFGISDRALRGWLAKYGGGSRPEVMVRAIVERAIHELHAILAGLDADQEVRAGKVVEEMASGVPMRHADSAPTSPVAPRPMPTGFFAGF